MIHHARKCQSNLAPKMNDLLTFGSTNMINGKTAVQSQKDVRPQNGAVRSYLYFLGHINECL